jgi:hypothetical protein
MGLLILVVFLEVEGARTFEPVLIRHGGLDILRSGPSLPDRRRLGVSVKSKTGVSCLKTYVSW